MSNAYDGTTLFPFQHAGHNRLDHRRRDDEWWQRVWHDPATRVLEMAGSALARQESGLRFVSPAEAPDGERFLLGEAGGETYVVVLTPERDDVDGFGGLRELALELDHPEASLAVHAVGLATWHRRHPRCSMCGEPTRLAGAGTLRRCPSCGAQHFPRTDPAVIMLIEDDHGRALLARHAHYGRRRDRWYTTLAGFVEPGESLEDAVRREVAEETSVRVGEVTYFASQPWPFPSSLMVAFRGRAMTTGIHIDEKEIHEARWFTREELHERIASGELTVPGPISTSYALIRDWLGGEVPGADATQQDGRGNEGADGRTRASERGDGAITDR